jgi:hypothetical protein
VVEGGIDLVEGGFDLAGGAGGTMWSLVGCECGQRAEQAGAELHEQHAELQTSCRQVVAAAGAEATEAPTPTSNPNSGRAVRPGRGSHQPLAPPIDSDMATMWTHSWLLLNLADVDSIAGGRAAERERDLFQSRSLAQGTSPVGGNQLREPLGKDDSRATPSTTAKAADSQAKDQSPTGERQVSHGAVIDTLHALGPPRTERTAGEACGCGEVQGDRLDVERHMLDAETSQVRKE